MQFNISSMFVSRLSALEQVREIRDYLYVQGMRSANFTSLSFLKNLRVIRGQNLLEYSG